MCWVQYYSLLHPCHYIYTTQNHSLQNHLLQLPLFSIFSCTFQNGSVVGPSVLAPLAALAVYGMGYRYDIEPTMQMLMTLSYLRFGIVGFNDILLNDRSPLKCSDELYCHYKDPQLLMRDMGMADTKFGYQLAAVFLFIILFRVVAFVALRCRLTAEFSVQIVNYATKVLRHK